METWNDEITQWLEPFVARLGHKRRRQMCPVYVAGLIGPGERKSVEPMAARLVPDRYDRLHHFISSGVWDAGPLEEELARQANRMVGGEDAVLVIDDTALPKKGRHSVGVAPQYASALGKNANCQTLVSVTLACDEVPVAVGLRLFLPDSWTSDPDRMERAGVPEIWRNARTKPEMALDEIDRLTAAGVRYGTVLADAGYGLSAPFRQGLSARELRWAVGIPRHQKVYPFDVSLIFPVAGHGRPRKNPIPDMLSMAAETMLADASWTSLSWRVGTMGPLEAAFAATRIRVADGKPQRILDKGQQHMPGEGSLADRRIEIVRRAQILPVQPASRHRPEDACGHHQGALGVRAGPSADEGGTRSRPLRGSLLARAPPTCADDHDRLCLPPAPAPGPSRAGKKESVADRLNPACRP
jgi:SRSO17 transposase